MKQNITIVLSVLLILVSLHKVTTSGISERLDINSSNASDSFIIGATDNAWQGNNDTLVKTLKHNVWHRYGQYPNGWQYQGAPSDSINADSSEYYQEVKSVINNNASENIMTIMDRGKISLLAWSQSSDYQCEETLSDNDYWFYGYNTHSNINMQDVTDNSQHGDGERVRYCFPHPSGPQGSAGWVVKDLKANREQINRDWWYELNDSIGRWYIKPKIRIDQSYANDPMNFDKEVCKIIILNFSGDTIQTVTLKVINFLDTTLAYDGNYLEKFYRLPINDSNLVIQNGSLFNPDRKGLGDMSCKVDFRVWYYGNCEMWIDRITVENEVAKDLLSNDTNNINYIRYDYWLRWESNLALENPDYIWNFYIEEFEFNNTKSIAYVNKKIKEYTNERFSLMVNLNYELYKVHIPYSWTYYFSAEKLNKYLFEPAEIDTYWNVAYVLEGWSRADSVSFGAIPNYHPNTLSNSDYNAGTGIQSYKTTPASYDDWLQVHFEQGPASVLYINQMKLADSLNKYYGKKVINLLQAHMWHHKSHKLKEPSNEELEMINMLPITYGAKGIIYFTYSSVGNIGEDYYYRGIIEPGTSPVTPRYYNVYGQEKWNKLTEIGSKLKKWGPYLMSFDNANRRSYIYRIADERNAMSANTFINKLKAYPSTDITPDSIPNLSGMTAETNTNAYLQAAFFQKINETEHSKYFMIVNRRCSPFINYSNTDNLGGRRFISMKINSSELTGFNNWKIIDLESNNHIATIDKNDTNYIYLGDFMPGEGKLYKLAPIMQEGGTLVANEEVGGNFDCKGEVNNDGYEIRILPGATINFSDSSARIIMTGGDFRSGSTPSENTAPVYLKGKNGSPWRGLYLSGCKEVEIFTTYFENILPYPVDSTYAAQLIDCEYLNISNSSFIAELDVKTGGLLINYTSESNVKEVYINYNHFQMDAGEMPALSVVTSGYITFPLIIENNEFESYTGNDNSANAILLSGVAGGVIKDNIITGYNNGIILIWSSMDLYGNIITGGDEDSKGILSCALSYSNLSPDGFVYTGGYNSISCEGENAKCLELDNSFNHLNDGYNIFNLNGYDLGNAFHIAGTISDDLCDETAGEADAANNCFRISNSDTNAAANVERIDEEPFNFIFIPYYCDDKPLEGMIAFDLGNGMYDTIYTEPGGSGGSISNVQFSMFNEQSATYENLSDSVSINLRKRDYERVSDLCYQLITDHIDSLKDVSII
ncbi:MAG: hypothetical protein IPM38_01845 [Ignavibacteria bacterium]|nr:hypothetical protein [Ignavibacteria bacterium]